MISTKGTLLRERPLVGKNASALEKGFIVYALSEKKRTLHMLLKAEFTKQQTEFLFKAQDLKFVQENNAFQSRANAALEGDLLLRCQILKNKLQVSMKKDKICEWATRI